MFYPRQNDGVVATPGEDEETKGLRNEARGPAGSPQVSTNLTSKAGL